MTDDTKKCPRCEGRGKYADPEKGPLVQITCPSCEGSGRVPADAPPMDSAAAAQTVERDKANADFRATSSPRPSARIQREQRAAHLTATEEARGAGLVNFGMIVTATALSDEQLPDVEAAIDNLAATARIQLRPVYGSQDSAFAAALPLGLVLPKHLKVPAEIRAAL